MDGEVKHAVRKRESRFSGMFRRNLSLQFGAAVLSAYIVISLLDVVYPQYIGVSNAFNLLTFSNPGSITVALANPVPPSLSNGIYYIFGTTAYEIPILPAILASIPVDLGFAVLIAGISAIIGVLVGVSTSYYSKKLELTISSLSNVFISFPLLISVVIFGVLMHFTLLSLIVGIVAVLWAYYAQLTRMLTLGIKQQQFVEAARAAGAPARKIITSHIIPNIMTPVLVRFSTDLATVVVMFSAVNFILYQVFRPFSLLPELGSLLAAFPAFGLVYGPKVGNLFGSFSPPTIQSFLLVGDWWTIVFPILFLLLLIVGLVSFSDGLRKAFDPRTTL